jgi:2-polyprenyl-3-methyl-5-hydroxy-6-metoxy-1,4-benzoquinol methylase
MPRARVAETGPKAISYHSHFIAMHDFNTPQDGVTLGDGYLYEELPLENVFGHSKKVRQFRVSIERMRRESRKGALRILDIGCGSGYAVTRFLGKAGDDVLGIDLHPPNIAYAENKFGRNGLRFSCMDARSLSSNGQVFDVLVMADVLEHLDDAASILATAAELLAADGRLLVTVPNGRGPFEIESALSRIRFLGPALLKITDLSVAALNKTVMKGTWSRMAALTPDDLPYNIDSGHVQFFSKTELNKLFNGAGLEVVGSGNISFLSGPFTNYLLAPSQKFCGWNVRVADDLPYWLASAWFFECRKVKPKG